MALGQVMHVQCMCSTFSYVVLVHDERFWRELEWVCFTKNGEFWSRSSPFAFEQATLSVLLQWTIWRSFDTLSVLWKKPFGSSLQFRCLPVPWERIAVLVSSVLCLPLPILLASPQWRCCPSKGQRCFIFYFAVVYRKSLICCCFDPSSPFPFSL